MSDLGEIIVLQISNLRCIKFANLQFDPKSGELITITGPNDAGKSTILDAIKFAIEGAAKIPEGVIRHGLYQEGAAAGQPIDRSMIRVHTSKGYIIERVIRKNNKGEQVAELQVIKEGEGKLPQAQTFLYSVSSKFPDPAVVADLDAKTLFKSIADMLKIDLDKYDHDLQIAQEKAKDARKRKKILGEKTKPAGEKVEPVDITEATQKFYQLQREFDEKNAQAKSFTLGKQRYEERIANLEIELADAKKELADLQKAMEAFEPPDTAKLNAAEERMTKAKEINDRAREWEEWERWYNEVQSIQRELLEAEEESKSIKEARDIALTNAKLPAGVYLEDETVKADSGIGWDSLSTSRKLEAATHLCIHSIPEGALRYLYIQRGESLGTQRRAQIAKIAKEQNVQVFMEVMSEDPSEGTITISQGEVATGVTADNDHIIELF